MKTHCPCCGGSGEVLHPRRCPVCKGGGTADAGSPRRWEGQDPVWDAVLAVLFFVPALLAGWVFALAGRVLERKG